MNPNNPVYDPYGAMRTYYQPPAQPQFQAPHFGSPALAPHYVNPGYMAHDLTSTTSATPMDNTTLDPWFTSLSVNLSNDIIGHFMAVMPALMTLFGILVGTAVIVVVYRFLTSKL